MQRSPSASIYKIYVYNMYKYNYFQSTFVRMIFGVNDWEIGNVIFKVRKYFI